LAMFNIMEDRPVNNFIGENRLNLNLEIIDAAQKFNGLRQSDNETIFEGLQGVLSEPYLTMIWDIIWRRWEDVKEFRAV